MYIELIALQCTILNFELISWISFQAFVIAYTSDFIPRSVYAFVYSPTEDLVGYIDSSLSEFNTSDYRDDMKSDADEKHPDSCQYRGYRNGPDHPDDPYGLSPQYWHVFAARLAFVVVFEHVVSPRFISSYSTSIRIFFVWKITSRHLKTPDVPRCGFRDRWRQKHEETLGWQFLWKKYAKYPENDACNWSSKLK